MSETFTPAVIVYDTLGAVVLQSSSTRNMILDPENNNRESMEVCYGGAAWYTSLTNNARADIYSSGSALGTIVDSWGYMTVADGGVAYNTRINADGGLCISSGGSDVSAIVNSDGGMEVCSGGTASKTIINAGGSLSVEEGGSALQVMASGGQVVMEEGACVTFASQIIGGTVVDGEWFVYDNTTLSNTTVNSAGNMLIFSGGTAVSNTIISEGSLVVSSGGSAVRNQIQSDSFMEVTSTGYAFDTTVQEGGSLMVWEEGIVSSVKIASSGSVRISDYGIAAVTIVSGGGNLEVDNHGIVSRTTVNASGCFYVGNGGIARNTIVCAGGSMMLDAESIHQGTLQLNTGAVVSAASEAVIDFTVAEQTAPASALVSNWSLLSGGDTALYTITVKNDQTAGTYVLASGAAGFDEVVTVQLTDGTALGSISVGETQSYSGMTFTLSKESSTLSLKLEGAVAGPAVKSDVDGNGISDVLFQYSGGDYRLGYWMNGTNEWRSENSAHPAAWEVLGAYDMNGDSKADAVYVGNVEAYGTKAAYIGYYSGGRDSDANWVNIGFLNNEADIDWKNKVGNLTGNVGKNSIVWHAAELGALGVWTDGTDSWTSLGGGFNENWTLVGTGDFDGDYKDSVLMSYNSGEKYYTVDLDGTTAELAASDSGWEVCAIGDFSGDGMDDIVVFHKETGIVAKWENGDSTQWSSLGQLDAKDWFVVGAGDYNNDEIDDLLVRQYSTGMLGYYTSGNMDQWNELGRGVDMNWTVVA